MQGNRDPTCDLRPSSGQRVGSVRSRPGEVREPTEASVGGERTAGKVQAASQWDGEKQKDPEDTTAVEAIHSFPLPHIFWFQASHLALETQDKWDTVCVVIFLSSAYLLRLGGPPWLATRSGASLGVSITRCHPSTCCLSCTLSQSGISLTVFPPRVWYSLGQGWLCSPCGPLCSPSTS